MWLPPTRIKPGIIAHSHARELFVMRKSLESSGAPPERERLNPLKLQEVETGTTSNTISAIRRSLIICLPPFSHLFD
ncbi:hypothetical protein TcasGA2_TC009136 [Tribolium castaneum]|uniref:Uncharacterized protein n=1 Tax=Tribolium castaneum TaxID=7070 RepID=D6WU29_TRICA|nr:hypothetical protein TcasGA2_TC009136 [Tribolium castaneum]